MEALDAALKTRLEDQGVLAAVDGRVFAGRAPRAGASGQAVRMPYVVYTEVSQGPRLWSSTHAYREHRLDWAVYGRTKSETSAVMPNWIAIGSTGRPQ